MPYKKLFFVSLFSMFVLAQFLVAVPSFAYQTIDTATALDQSFTAGYTERSFAEKFHKDSDAPAELENGLDGWYISKGFNFATTYDSNIFSTRKNLNADWIFTYTPTIGIERKSDALAFNTFYDISYADYLDNDDLDRFNHAITSYLAWNKDHYGKKLKVEVNNTFKPDTAYLTGERTEFRSAEGGRIITYSDNGSVKLSYELTPKTSVFFTQGLSVYDFNDTDNKASVKSLSERTFKSTPAFSYKLTPKMSLNGWYTYESADFYETGGRFDSDTHIFGGSLTGKLGAKTNASFGVDYRSRDYTLDGVEGSSDAEFTLALSHRLTEKLSATIWGTRSLGENFDTSGGPNPNELKHFIGGNLTWRVLPKVSVDGSTSIGFAQRDGTVTQNDPENGTSLATKSDTRSLENQFYETSLGLDWNPRPFLDVFVGYKFFRKDSSFKNFEYTDHKTVGSVRLKF